MKAETTSFTTTTLQLGVLVVQRNRREQYRKKDKQTCRRVNMHVQSKANVIMHPFILFLFSVVKSIKG